MRENAPKRTVAELLIPTWPRGVYDALASISKLYSTDYVDDKTIAEIFEHFHMPLSPSKDAKKISSHTIDIRRFLNRFFKELDPQQVLHFTAILVDAAIQSKKPILQPPSFILELFLHTLDRFNPHYAKNAFLLSRTEKLSQVVLKLPPLPEILLCHIKALVAADNEKGSESKYILMIAQQMVRRQEEIERLCQQHGFEDTSPVPKLRRASTASAASRSTRSLKKGGSYVSVFKPLTESNAELQKAVKKSLDEAPSAATMIWLYKIRRVLFQYGEAIMSNAIDKEILEQIYDLLSNVSLERDRSPSGVLTQLLINKLDRVQLTTLNRRLFAIEMERFPKAPMRNLSLTKSFLLATIYSQNSNFIQDCIDHLLEHPTELYGSALLSLPDLPNDVLYHFKKYFAKHDAHPLDKESQARVVIFTFLTTPIIHGISINMEKANDQEERARLGELIAQIHKVTPTSRNPDGPETFRHLVEKMIRQIEGAVSPVENEPKRTTKDDAEIEKDFDNIVTFYDHYLLKQTGIEADEAETPKPVRMKTDNEDSRWLTEFDELTNMDHSNTTRVLYYSDEESIEEADAAGSTSSQMGP
jgi:hypothetical protein